MIERLLRLQVKKSIFEEAIASWGLGNSDEPKVWNTSADFNSIHLQTLKCKERENSEAVAVDAAATDLPAAINHMRPVRVV